MGFIFNFDKMTISGTLQELKALWLKYRAKIWLTVHVGFFFLNKMNQKEIGLCSEACESYKLYQVKGGEQTVFLCGSFV